MVIKSNNMHNLAQRLLLLMSLSLIMFDVLIV